MLYKYPSDLTEALRQLINSTKELFFNYDDPDSTCEFNALLVLAGFGAVQSTVDDEGGTTWSLVGAITHEIASSVRKHAVALNRDGRPSVAPSLGFAIERINASSSDTFDSDADIQAISSDCLLLYLAGKGYARLMLCDDEVTGWIMTTALLAEFKLITTWEKAVVKVAPMASEASVQVVGAIITKVRMDELLRLVIHSWSAQVISRADNPWRSPEEVFMELLLGTECSGDSIASIDVDGELSWRASEQLISKYINDDDNDDCDNNNDDDCEGYFNDNDNDNDDSANDDNDDDDVVVPVCKRGGH